MVSINIEEYKNLYANEINSLLQKDINYIPKISTTKHSLLLFENQRIIGIGSIWENAIHPYRDYISIYIDPVDYNISNPIVGLCNLSEKQIEDVVVLQYEDYKINHQHINPLSEGISMEEWKMVAFRDLVKKDSYVMLDGSNNVCAYLLSYEIDEETIEIGHTGSRCNNIKDYKAFLYNVVKQLFNSYKEIELEIDDCDMGANILGELFTYKTDISWDAYIRGNLL